MGAVAHSNSGAGHIKDDGHTDDLLIEIKDARKLYTLHADELEATHMRALQQDRRGVWFIFFSDRNWTAEVRLIPGGKELLG